MKITLHPRDFFLHLKRHRLEICQKTRVTGNPLGYHRTTQKLKRTAAARRYEEWKDWVWAQAEKQGAGKLRAKDDQKFFLSVMIYFENKAHSDPSNVFKGIEDALADSTKRIGRVKQIQERFYKNDKHGCGCFDFEYSKEDPRVEIEFFPVESVEKITMKISP